MSRQYPIWNQVEACYYQSNKSYGNKSTGKVSVFVGSSNANSEHFLDHIVTRRSLTEYKGYKNVMVFKFSVDGIILKEMIFSIRKDGNAEKLLKTNSKLNKIKSL